MSQAEPVQYLTQSFVLPNNDGLAITGSPILVSNKDWPGVVRVAKDLQKDLAAVIGKTPILLQDKLAKTKTAIIVGTIGRSSIIDQLIRARKLDVKGVQGQWESYVVQTIKNPLPGVQNAVVIAGSDKRGTIYGTYELSEQAGVSPWYFWADVPIKRHNALSVKPGRFVQASPKVKYRGIFINDEAPCLSNWVYKNFGEYKHEFYVHVFELILRLRGNYLWPAMWNNRFNEDDPLNPKLADEYGVVMGTSHVEPMGRADKEWNHLGFKPEQWNYAKYPNELEKFWADGVRRNKPYETITTMAMRGKIDTPMSENENINLLEKIVDAQRKIIAKEVNPDVAKVPQLWCLYKEVQSYYDHGMRVPDDVTLLWADDNWGNIRRLPTPEERKRKGGAGVYYHFDYVGGPRNYKWIDTNPLPRIWEQMHMAYERGADRIWIVNVGDIKPNEFPTEFFVRMGWDPDRWNYKGLKQYTANWMRREFGPEHADTMAELMETYTKLNARRKPELLDPSTYSLVNYNEAELALEDWDHLARVSKTIHGLLPANQKDAFFELLGYPIQAAANLNNLYVAAAKNRLFASQGRASVNLAYQYANECFQQDKALQAEYHSLAGGKWDHMMDQTHIGYTTWQQPDQNNMPAVVRVPPQQGARLGLAVEGNVDSFPNLKRTSPRLPLVSICDTTQHYFELFNRGIGSLSFSVKTSEPWLLVSHDSGEVDQDRRIFLSVYWDQVPISTKSANLTVTGSDGTVITVEVPIRPRIADDIAGYVETDGAIAIDALGYKRKVDGKGVKFVDLPDLGRLGSAITLMPTTASKQSLTANPVFVEYPIYLFSSGDIKIQTVLSPTQHLQPGDGLHFAVSLDGGAPQVVNMHENYVYFTPTWEASVAQNAIVKSIPFSSVKPGRHTIRFYAIDPGVVLQRIIIDAGGLKPSYLGPPDSVYIEAKK